MIAIEKKTSPQFLTSFAQSIATRFRKLLDWPNRGEMTPRLAVPLGAIVLLAAFVSLDITANGQIVVNNTQDNLTAGNGLCTLREAIVNANGGAAFEASGGDCAAGNAGADVITLPPGNYRLSIAGAGENGALTGDLDIFEDLTINGGVPQPTIQGSRDRVFDVLMGSTFTLDNVRVTGGDAGAAGPDDNGGGIQACCGTTVNIQNGSNIDSNKAHNNGGGISCVSCFLNITGGSRIFDNKANDNRSGAGDGGGVYIDGAGNAALTLMNSTIGGETVRNGDKNTAVNGAGLFIGDDVVTNITGSTISGNEATNNGGGINDARTASGTTLVVNSTISGNKALNDGGGFYINDTSNQSPSTTIKNVTVSNNTADSDNRNGGSGGGLFHNDGTVLIFNSIFAQNIDRSSEPDCNSVNAATGDDNVNSGGNNIVGDNTGCATQFPAGNTNANGDIVGTTASPIDARLEALDTNPPGVPSTHMLLSDSPALDFGDNTICADGDVNNLDERGVVRPQQFNGVTNCDSGAVELQRVERFGVAQALRVSSVFPVPFSCGMDQKTILNMGNEFISKEKHETYIKIINPEKRTLLIFRSSSQAQIAQSLTLNRPAEFQVPGVMSPFVLLRINPGKTIQIKCSDLFNYPIQLDGNGNIQTTLLDELGDPDTFFQGVLFLETNSRDLQVLVQLVTQTWTATPPLGGGSPATFTGGERLLKHIEVFSETATGSRAVPFRVVPQGAPLVASASIRELNKVRDQSPRFVHMSAPGNRNINFQAQNIPTQELEVQIYSLSGNQVFEQSTRGNVLQWNLRDTKGRPVSNGVYLYVLKSRGPDGKIFISGVKKLLVLR